MVGSKNEEALGQARVFGVNVGLRHLGGYGMVKEVDIQTKIKKSIIRDGGFSIKLSNAYSSGIPDLLCALPPYAPCLIEVKDLKSVYTNFDLQVGVTSLQAVTLNRITQPYEEYSKHVGGLWQASGIFVTLYHNMEHRIVALPKHAARLDASYQADPRCWRKRQEGVDFCPGGYYQVAPLLEYLGIAKVI